MPSPYLVVSEMTDFKAAAGLTSYNDLLKGANGDDILTGDDAGGVVDDKLIGGNGADTFFGGATTLRAAAPRGQFCMGVIVMTRPIMYRSDNGRQH
jgi:hypothetical protein